MDKKALRDCEIETMATSAFGVLNNKHWIREKGFRTLKVDGKDLVFPSLSGKEATWDEKEIQVDGVTFRLVRHKGEGRVKYAGASRNRGGRCTDRLILNYSDAPCKVAAGSLLSAVRYTVR